MTTQAQVAKAKKAALAALASADNARAFQQKQQAAIQKLNTYNTQISKLNYTITDLKTQNAYYAGLISTRDAAYYVAYRAAMADGNISAAEALDLKTNSTYGSDGTAGIQKVIDTNTAKITSLYQDIKNYKQKIAELNSIFTYVKPNLPGKSSSTSSGTNATTNQGTINFSQDYKYNAPMVRSAYFTSAKGVGESLVGVTNDGNFVDQGSYNDAMKAWTGTTGGRGTIQMDRKFVNALAKTQENQVTPLDPQMYGFKFLYNPKEVAMAWGIMDKMDPEYLASGNDPFTVISAGLMSATITITILLNRIGDFSFINETGYNQGFGKTNISPDDVIRNLQQNTNGALINPYPENVENEEVQEIYKKGTMYDIEYLFKTLNGPHATFVSKLNGKTADRGWLRPSIVELHLGAGMRYRARVATFAVTHSVFNSRMVPILSSVQLTLGRFNDGPETNGATLANPYGSTGGSYVGSRFVPNP